MLPRLKHTASLLAVASTTLFASACSSTDDAQSAPYSGLHDAAGGDASKPGSDAMPEADGSQEAGDGGSKDGHSDVATDSPAKKEGGMDGGLDATHEPDGPSWIVNGVAICPEAAALCDSGSDASGPLQLCIDRTPDAMALELEPCRYSVAGQLHVDRAITVRTRGKAAAASCTANASHGCAELFALPAFNQTFGMLTVKAAATIDHLALHGNRQGRGGTNAASMCSTLTDNAYGFNGSLMCSGCTLQDSVSMYALCGTGFLAAAGGTITVARSTFAYNGVHTTKNMWADGLTVHDADHSSFTDNVFVDNTDIDLIFGGCRNCAITGNVVKHTSDPAGGSFAAIMIQKWPSTSGCYEGVDVSGNSVDCGPLRNCGSGLYIGSESWYPETPYGASVAGTTSGLITNNTVVNAMNALYIAAKGLAIYGNNFVNAHGIAIPVSCAKSIKSVTPIVVSPTAQSCHFNYENVDPVMSKHYSSANWSGCIPNYPF
jgi:hypothetical protein